MCRRFPAASSRNFCGWREKPITADPLIARPPSWFTLSKALSLGIAKYLRRMTWKPGRSAFSFMGGLSEVDPSIAKNAACLSICVWRKDYGAMIFFPNAAWVSFPLSTLPENATTHFLCAITGANLFVDPLLTASASVAVFLAFCSEPLGVALSDTFYGRDPFIDSKFGVSSLPVASAGCFFWKVNCTAS